MLEIAGLENFKLRGSGGFADVYEADETGLSRRVAVKMFRARVGGDDRRSFEREAHALGRLSGIRNVVQVYRSGVTDDDHPFFVMELMDGSLADVLVDGPVPVADACQAGVLLGQALMAAHREGIMHRDIKPGNILIDRYGEPALSDFGISGLADAGTSSFIYAFTAEHAAPEVFDRLDPTPAADIYSLACTLYASIEGRPPFERGEGEGALTFMRRVQEAPCPPCTAAVAFDPALDVLVCSAMEKDPAARPSLREFVDGLAVYTAAGETRSGGEALTVPPRAGAVVPTSGSPTRDPVGFAEASSVPGVAGAPGPGTGGPGGPVGPAAAAAAAAFSDPHQPRRSRSGRILAGVVLVLLVVALAGVGAAAWISIRGSEDEAQANEQEQLAATGSDETTTSTIPPEPRPNGVSNAAPAADSGAMDTSGMLRAGIEAFAASTDASAVNAPATRRDVDGVLLRFGTPPTRVDYAATNDAPTTECLKIYTDDLIVVGAAGSFWSDGQIVVGLNAVQFDSELQAKQYYWSTALFFGLGDDNCAGWPDDQIAVNPTDLTVNRQDFPVAALSEDVVTAIDDTPNLGGIDGVIQYEVVTRHGDLVLTASVTSVAQSLDPTVAAGILSDAIAAFPPA